MDLLIFGTSNSIMLALVATGFSLTFGISGVANFAYGAIYVCGGLFVWALISKAGIPYLPAIVISIFTMGLFGYALYWVFLVRLRGMVLNEVIATFAVGMAILQLLRYMGFHGYEYVLPPFMQGSIAIWGVGIELQRLWMIGIGAALVFFLYVFTHYTRLGLAFRGMSQEERTAITVGIDSDKTAALALAFGSSLATVAAITILPLGIINIDSGFDALIYALAVGMVGGLESIPGVIIASFILGFSQQIVAVFLGSTYTMVVFLSAIIIVLAIKPAGILGKFKELEERV